MEHVGGFSSLIAVFQLINLLIIFLIIFFFVKVILFMNRKNNHDESLNNKLDKLIELLEKNNSSTD